MAEAAHFTAVGRQTYRGERLGMGLTFQRHALRDRLPLTRPQFSNKPSKLEIYHRIKPWITSESSRSSYLLMVGSETEEHTYLTRSSKPALAT